MALFGGRVKGGVGLEKFSCVKVGRAIPHSVGLVVDKLLFYRGSKSVYDCNGGK